MSAAPANFSMGRQWCGLKNNCLKQKIKTICQ
jgi:hypothetical protein